jgi:hypothetical protein
MKTIQTTVYEFSELNANAKEKARDWYRSCNDGDNYWSKSVIEDAEQCAEFLGIEFAKRDVRLMGGGTRQDSRVFWSGFGSQGDGACFDGDWHAANVKPGKLAEHAPQDTELHQIASEFERIAKEFPQSSFSVKHSGHYSHQFCTEFDVQMFGDNDDAAGLKGENETAQAEKDLIEVARDFMQWIYRQLEKEYEWVNADAQVDDAIIANEYTFTEAGKRCG